MAHVPDINGFIKGLKTLLKDNGKAIVEVPYFLDLVKKFEFDTINAIFNKMTTTKIGDQAKFFFRSRSLIKNTENVGKPARFININIHLSGKICI